MKAIDTQCQILTPWGSTLTPQDAKQIGQYLGVELKFGCSDEEMADIYRKANVKAMFVGPCHFERKDIGWVREKNNLAHEFQKKYPDVVAGCWAGINPHLGAKGMKELERCIKDLKFVGYYAIHASMGVPINNKLVYPFYDLCQDAGVPVKMNIGHTMIYGGTPGGGGFHLKEENPWNFDDVCADFPNLTCIAAHNPWPWHLDMISILLHKGNAYCDNHGWPPSTLPPEMIREVNGRLNHKFIFGSDYPFYPYDRIFKEWESLVTKPEKLQNMYINNARKLFKHLSL